MNFLVFQWQVGHVLHFFFPGNKSPDGSEAKSAEKQQQRNDAKPLNAIHGLKQIFVHFPFD